MATSLAKNNEAQCSGPRTVSMPETRGNLGMHRHIKGSNSRLPRSGDWKFLQIKLDGFAQICQGFLDGLARLLTLTENAAANAIK
ncbi:MAG: hypothetical protein HY080_16275 [Gammaproteobacteria bacterium]|nr:hypothetical protein [Gammaproteobacteria bacterium]